MTNDGKQAGRPPATTPSGAAGNGGTARTSTRLVEDIATAEMKERYDAHCKRLLSHKPILARIMKGCMEEYRDCPVEEIESLIEGTPAVGTFPLHGGQPVAGENPRRHGADVIYGQNTEDASPTDGIICYDIRFTALAPSTKEPIQLIINVEAQNRFKPGYPLVKRGVYYASRLISAQGRTEVKGERYDRLKKVYSVWICTAPPVGLRNTIVEFKLGRSVLAGKVPDDAFSKPDYDLLSVIFVNLGGKGGENSLLEMLNLLLLDGMKASGKCRRLERDFGIAMYEEIPKELLDMCNLSEGVYERGIEWKAMDTARNLIAMNALTHGQIAQAVGLPLEQVEELARQAGAGILPSAPAAGDHSRSRP